MKLRKHLYPYIKISVIVVSKCGVTDYLRFLWDYVLVKGGISKRISVVKAQYAVESAGIAHQKYLDTNFWLFENLARVFSLGLHKKKGARKSVLDIGTGPGYFPFLCKYYGHHAEALDVADNAMYNDLVKALDIKRHVQRIEAYETLEIASKFDLISAFMICFNNHQRPNLWHIQEWNYFLNSLHLNNLRNDGEIFLSLNSESPEEPISKELLRHFSVNGAVVHETTVHINSDYNFNPSSD